MCRVFAVITEITWKPQVSGKPLYAAAESLGQKHAAYVSEFKRQLYLKWEWRKSNEIILYHTHSGRKKNSCCLYKRLSP